MEASSMAAVGMCLTQRSPWIKYAAGGADVRVSPASFVAEKWSHKVDLKELRWCATTKWNGRMKAKISRSCSCHTTKSGAYGSESLHECVDEALILKRNAQEVVRYLNERCIYLVGMMGSGKSTVGKILAEVLGYSYFDSDKLVEQAVGIDSVAEIFKKHSEAFFRDSESEVLRDLSSMRRLVVATGGGAVIRPINWKYMKRGITVWLDVPLEALARRIAAVGLESRPLLHGDGDPYTKAFARLSMLAEQRGEAYANADVRVCLQYMADKKGIIDVCALTPTDIAIEALIKIENVLTTRDAIARESRYLQS